MGYYIETPGQMKGKAQAIIDKYGAQHISPPSSRQIPVQQAIICVVDNGVFEAAAFCYSEEELTVFATPDGRRKDWLIMDRAKACELTGYSE